MPNLTKEQTESGMKSLSAHIAALTPGASHALATKMGDPCFIHEIDNELEALSNRGRSAIARAKHATKHEFTGEGGVFRTGKTGDMIVCFVITRTA